MESSQLTTKDTDALDTNRLTTKTFTQLKCHLIPCSDCLKHQATREPWAGSSPRPSAALGLSNFPPTSSATHDCSLKSWSGPWPCRATCQRVFVLSYPQRIGGNLGTITRRIPGSSQCETGGQDPARHASTQPAGPGARTTFAKLRFTVTARACKLYQQYKGRHRASKCSVSEFPQESEILEITHACTHDTSVHLDESRSIMHRQLT